MRYTDVMVRTTTEIPISWKTTKSVANRLLGETGRPLFDKLLAETQGAAKKRRWPLQNIKVEHYQDPEEDWEYMFVTLDFDCARSRARKLWNNYLDQVVDGMKKDLQGEARDIFARRIHYGLESDP